MHLTGLLPLEGVLKESSLYETGESFTTSWKDGDGRWEVEGQEDGDGKIEMEKGGKM